MKKTLLALLASALISLTMVSGIAYASEDASPTLTVTETPMMSQVLETVLPESQPEQYQSIAQTETTESNIDQAWETDTLIETNSSENTTEESNSEDNQDIPSDASLLDPELEEITETEATTLSMDSNSEYEVMSMNGKFHKKKKHHHDNHCGHQQPLTTGSIDLWIRKGASINWNNTWNVWDTVNYVITYGNAWNITATWVTITESFPIWFVSTGGLAGWINIPGTTLYTYTIGTLTPGQSGQITFNATILVWTNSWVSIPNIAQVSSSTTEDAILLANNIASATIIGFGTWNCGCTWATATWWFYGRVFFDADNNALLGTGETFVSWATVLLKSSTGIVLQTLFTDMSGNYYGSAPVWLYSIEVIPLTWYVVTTLNPENITLLSGLTYNAGDDGLYQSPGNVTTWSIDLWIKKTATINWNNTWNVGDTITYTLTYWNTGSNAATWVVLTDSFPIWFVSTWGLLSWVNQTGTTLFTFFVGSLAPGQTGQIIFTGTLLIWNTGWILVPNIVQITSTTFENQNTLADNISIASVTGFGTWNCGCVHGVTGSFQWRVYFDNDNNGVKWGTDTYAQWVTVLIKSLTWLVLMTLTTDENWNYNGVIWSWSYVIQVLPLPWYNVTTANPETLVIMGDANTDLWEDGLYKAPGGGGGWWYAGGGGYTTPIPPVVPPVVPVTPSEPLIPIGPLPEQPILPTELLSSGPDLEGIFEDSTTAVANAATTIVHTITRTTTNYMKNMPISRPLTYVNVLSGFESALSLISIMIITLVSGFSLVLISLFAVRVTTIRIN